MIVADDIFVMLLTEEKFKTFTPKQICDATKKHGGACVPIC
jgi:predicted lactoylglutathione lyase